MPQESQLAHRVLTNMALPYITNVSPSNTDPHFIFGSTDILTSINGYAERRPGFANTVEQTPTTFNDLQRLFTWDRFDGAFFVMACDIGSDGKAAVYKMQVGTDASFVLIFTEPSMTMTAYDFVVSNNTIYFSNGFYVRKWDPLNGVSNWGIAPYSASASVSEYAGTGANVTFLGSAWSNPSNATGSPDGSYATCGPIGFSTNTISDYLSLTAYGFSVPAGNVINGFEIAVTGHYTQNTGTGVPRFFVQLLQDGNPVGGAAPFNLTTSDTTVTIGSAGDLFSATWSSSNVNASTFGVYIYAVEFADGVSTASLSIDAAQITVFSTGGPVVSVSGSGTMFATVGYQYVICWGNSRTGHVSSPSPPSNSTGIFGAGISTSTLAASGTGYAPSDTGIVVAGNDLATYSITTVDGSGGVLTYSITVAGGGYSVANNVPTAPGGAQPGAGSGFTLNITALTGAAHVSIPVVASTDPQVNQIRIFRTTDSANGLGGQAYFEIPNSPVANSSTTITDDAPDAALNVESIAPVPTFNDPPTPIQGMVYFSGRFWGFIGNTVWFTGLEEITIGVPEESMPSGIAGNFWAFDEPVQGLAAAGIGANQALVILCGGTLYVIQGNSLDTFVRYQVSARRGCRNRACVTTLGGMVAWLDSANQVWAFDGSNLNELSTLIRTDFTNIVQANCSMSFHSAGRFHWLVLSTGTLLYIYDIDQDQWMPPWTFAADYIFSGETSPGNYVLMASSGTEALQLNPSDTAGSFNDDGATYSPVAKLGLLSVVPDYGNKFSYIGVGSYNEPTRTGYPVTFQVTNNGQTLSDFLICSDEDPTVASYTTIATNLADTATAFNRTNGSSLKQLVYQTTAPASRWIGIQVVLANADQVDNIYEVFMAYKSLGGR